MYQSDETFPFMTPVDLPADFPRIGHDSHIMLWGSCFAQAIGKRLCSGKFRCDVNPYGILYNPLSIATALTEVLDGKRYTSADLFASGGLWHSFMHHGDFSASDAGEALQRINTRLTAAAEELPSLDFLLLTFGSAVVYEHLQTRRVVGNCHKLPEHSFRRFMLRVDDVVQCYDALLQRLFLLNPRLVVYFTVSPVRYLRDGLHTSQLSKSVLLLAIDEIARRYPGRVCYFPAYEIVTDELRDYRFYADDLVHPTDMAVGYVWRRFCQACISPAAAAPMAACMELQKMLAHRPIHPESAAYKHFLEQIVLKIDQLVKKYPYLALQNEREECHIRLKALLK